MDAARAAAMSDPTMNHWFRRRWVDCDAVSAVNVAKDEQDGPELIGLALLADWRQQRKSEQAPAS